MLLRNSPGLCRQRLESLHCLPCACGSCQSLKTFGKQSKQCVPRMSLHIRSCRFSNCQHIHEPGCAVRGEWERYPFYLEILEETKAKEDRDRHRSASKKVCILFCCGI